MGCQRRNFNEELNILEHFQNNGNNVHTSIFGKFGNWNPDGNDGKEDFTLSVGANGLLEINSLDGFEYFNWCSWGTTAEKNSGTW